MSKRKIVFLTGAGMSAESGISTFRDAGGLWEQYPVMQVASHQGWLDSPLLVNQFYNERRAQLLTTTPCTGHRLVAALEAQYDVTIVTQNVDDLHERAGSSHVIHLHGELMKVCSSRDVNDPRFHQTLTAAHSSVSPGQLAGDGSLLRPFIVFFGEDVPLLEDAAHEVYSADILIIIGTSLAVYPAASLIHYARRDTQVYLIDPCPPEVPSHVHVIPHGASEGMQLLCDMLG